MTNITRIAPALDTPFRDFQNPTHHRSHTVEESPTRNPFSSRLRQVVVTQYAVSVIIGRRRAPDAVVDHVAFSGIVFSGVGCVNLRGATICP